MVLLLLLAATVLPAQGAPGAPAHSSNPVYRGLIESGFVVDGKVVPFPEPLLRDGLTGDEQRTVLRKAAGSERAAEELVRPSVTAPFVLRVRDEKTARGDLVRLGDLWFVVHARLDAIDPAELARQGRDAKPTEVGNMRFASRLLDAKQREARGIRDREGENEWYVHLSGRLLDRIAVEETDRVTASRSPESWVIAARREPRFDRDPELPNRWSAVRASDDRAVGDARGYAGGASYLKITQLSAVPDALLVEVHFAFAEPRAWFDGAPILRSKISLVAQDRIRSLRRELAKSRARR